MHHTKNRPELPWEVMAGFYGNFAENFLFIKPRIVGILLMGVNT